MRKYKVTVILPDEQLESTYAVEIEADNYETKATQGAGMIADFYENNNSNPFATFARVLSVQRIDNVEDRVILTKDEAQYLSNLVTQPGQFTEGNKWMDLYRKLNG